MKTFLNWLFIIFCGLTVISAFCLMVIEAVYSWFHPQFTKMMLFQKFLWPDIILLVLGCLVLIIFSLSDRK